MATKTIVKLDALLKELGIPQKCDQVETSRGGCFAVVRGSMLPC